MSKHIKFRLFSIPFIVTGILLSISSNTNADSNPPYLESEYLIVVHEDLMCDAVNDLANYREQQGLKVYTQIILDGFTYDDIYNGISEHYSPANNKYQLLYVLLIGDAAFGEDDWDEVNSITGNFIPSHFTWGPDQSRMIGFDMDYACVDDDEAIRQQVNSPDLYLGRIPAEDTSEVRIYVEKILEYEGNGSSQSWKDNALLIGGDFERGSPPAAPPVRHVTALLEDTISLNWDAKTLLYSTNENSPSNRADSLTYYLNDGQLVMSLLATGATSRKFGYYIEPHFFTAASNLSNYLKYPIVYGASCDIGRFDDIGYINQYEPFYRDFLFAEDAGAIGWISPEGATGERSNEGMSFIFYDCLINKRIGDLGILNYTSALDAFLSIRASAMTIRRYNLYGDPALRIQTNPGFSRTFRGTGFELHDIRALQNTVFYSINCSNLGARIIPEKYCVESPFGQRWSLQSKRVYGVKGEDLSSTQQSRAYWKLTDDDIPIGQLTRFLSFWLYVEESPDDLGHICLDAVVIDEDPLHDQLIYDQYGQRIGPEHHNCSQGEWRLFAFDLEPLYGETLDNLLIGYDDGNNSEIGNFKAYIDEVKFAANWGVAPTIYEHIAPETLFVNYSDTIFADVYDSDIIWDRGDSIEFTWSAVNGSIIDTNTTTTIYTAPMISGITDTVFFTVTDRGMHQVIDTILITIYDSLTINGGSNKQVTLSNSTPNPFNAVVEIQFTLPRDSHINLEIFNLRGQRVTELANGHYKSGKHSIHWDARDYSSGIYLYKLTTDNQSLVKRMTLLK